MVKDISGNSFVEVNISIIKQNLKVLKEFLPTNGKQMAVVKANAYGHGAVEVARAIEKQVAWFAVNDVEEGIELREVGISNPILVFGVPTAETAPTYKNHDLTATVSSLSHFRLLNPGTDYHLNFDTGMGRLGLVQDEITQTQKAIQNYSELRCTGIYSHFATADNPGSEKAEEQLVRFKSICQNFEPEILTHMANTGGTAFYPEAHFDMVRNGIGIYGYAPGSTEIEGLVPAIRWQSHLVQVKQISKGETVSYGARWKAPENGFVGTIPMGYEEGIPRLLTGNMEVAINQQRYTVVGTVTMNYIMVFLGSSDIPAEGEPVELLGSRAMTADQWAANTQTIPYEIVTGISCRVPRIYKRD
ncbi:alanine racemase [Aliifodinibius sp. S!AR15-10]|uniref:alanine racemase n=1 Tax=Aliifodinibius sp. S!AR15-10 TaxID=2950437 RepID=UPI002861440E|nr:alanine racemase [Aliifodinibius sp. S!AR15-10]MDR8392741.1 alanine racemase [Aliifodinibius sp. S!AR15-10]